MNVIPMTSKTLIPFAAAVLIAGLITGLASTAAAQKKPKAGKACGITAIPLQVGNKWVYEQVLHPTPLDPSQAKLVPAQAKSVTITVDAVEPPTGAAAKDKNAVTTVKLTEVVAIQVLDPAGKAPPKIEEKKIESTLTCTATTMSISPESFWFAGEPGGFWNVQLEGIERPGQTLSITGGKLTGAEWHDDIKARWKRTGTPGTDADLGSGTFALDRRIVFTGEEPVNALVRQYPTAKKLGIETKGEVAVDNATGKPYLLPEGIVGFVWIVDGVGIVQVHNSFVHAYQLKEVSLQK